MTFKSGIWKKPTRSKKTLQEYYFCSTQPIFETDRKFYCLNFNTSDLPFLKILLLFGMPLRNAFCSS